MSAAQQAPIAVQYLRAALDVMPAECRTLPAGSRAFRAALAVATERLPMRLHLSRRELSAAAAYLGRTERTDAHR
jgi:hypothetical protein